MPTALLFPAYAFVEIVSGWWEARWAAGVIRLVTCGGNEPAHVPDRLIADLRARERDGLIVLPKKRGMQRGDPVRVKAGPFTGQLAIYDGQRPHERVMVLPALLGSVQRVELAERDIRPA
jgi:transcriptional antiterminator RfaH